MQAQIQLLLVVERVAREQAVVAGKGFQPNTESNVEITKPQIFDRTTNKILVFLTACKLYIKMKMRNTTVKKQV